jgi:serine/threonine protein kinase
MRAPAGSAGEAAPATGDWAVALPAGYRIGPWRVTDPIATGSWSSVYGATWAEPGPPPADSVALKVHATGTVTARQLRHLREMADRELRFHASGAHPRLIRAYESRQIDDPAHPELDGAPVLVLQRARCSAADLLRAHPGQPVPRAAELVEQIAEGLTHMHSRGWVHGDLKPSNVLIMADGSVRLADFGLTGELEGTHAYLPPAASSDYVPPERAGERLSERGMAVRQTADVWAFGVTACELLTGEHPFPGSSARSRARAAGEYVAAGRPLALPGNLPPSWEAIIRDCLAPTHEARSRHDAGSLLRRIRALTGLHRPPRVRLSAVVAAALALLMVVLLPPATRDSRFSAYRPDLLRVGVGIPDQYRELIVAAGTHCKAPGLSPALVAAILKVESDFNPDLWDSAKDEYGIARWTPRVLAYHLTDTVPSIAPIATPPFSPAVSIAAVGRFLCYLSPKLGAVPGDPALLLAAAYRTSAATITAAQGVPARLQPYTEEIQGWLRRYQP